MSRIRRTLSLVAGLILASTSAVVVATVEPAAAATYSGYAMVYFKESNGGLDNSYKLHLAVSPDGLNWTPLNQNQAVADPTLGTLGLRDPFVLRKQDGTFEIVATDLNGTDWSQQNEYIHVWDSTDLRTFTGYRRVKLHSLATHSWAPEAFWDASRGQYAIIYSANNGTRDVIMVNYTTDFVNVSAAQTYFDPGFNVIDANVIVGTAGTNYLYYKVANSGTLQGAKSTSLAAGSFNSGTYTSAIAQGGTEAPILVQSLTNTSNWYLWGDTYTPNGVFYAWQNSNINANSWTALDQKLYTQPLHSKHASITPITATEMSNLITKWGGTPGWNRLKSYNFPGRYVRHSNFVGRIDAYPFDPYLDSEWKIVPGLADAAAVSFQSVNYPARYLRHANYNMVVDADDGTTQFDQDATFYPTAGLADSGWTSYRSYNYPTRYLRHSNYVLRIDVISSSSSTTDKQDATFKVGY